jgi:hypothetical protein
MSAVCYVSSVLHQQCVISAMSPAESRQSLAVLQEAVCGWSRHLHVWPWCVELAFKVHCCLGVFVIRMC